MANCAGVIALCFLLLASTVAIPQGNVLLTPAYAQQTEGSEAETAEQEANQRKALVTMQRIAEVGEITDSQGLAEVAEVSNSEELAELVGASNSEELEDLVIPQPNLPERPTTEEPPAAAGEEEPPAAAATSGTTDSEVIEEIVRVQDLDELAELVGASNSEELEDLVIPQPNLPDQPTTDNPPADNPPADNPPADNPPADNPPADNPPADNPPADNPPADNPPADEGSNPPNEGGTDRFGVDEIYSTAGDGPSWYIREQQDPTADGNFYYGMYEGTTIEYQDNGIWEVDARSGTPEHGIRMHVDSPNGVWKNTEITGYFNVHTGDDQITMIARHGPSYHDNGGCDAYGYYGMTAVDGNVFFKKKLYHFNDGYTQRVAEVDALESILNEWIGMKFVVYDLADGAVKLELWIDEGDMTNNWRKVTELVDEGGLSVEGGADCGRQSDHIIEEGTRVSYRVDNSLFEFKKLSVREIG
jgi:hypothetical protein